MRNHNEIINDLYTRSVGSIIGSNLVRIETLRQLVYQTYGNSSIETATKLNIFIDLTSVMHGLYSEHNRIVTENITDISSMIINMCGHYRSFFRDSLGVDTRIFLINSLNTCDINSKFVDQYNAVFKNKCEVTEGAKLIANNMTLLKILCPYLPAIYYVDSIQQFETSVIIAYLIEMLNDPNPNLIISHDMYPMQLCAQYKWTSYLYPIKRKDASGILYDASWMLPVNDKETFRSDFWNRFAETKKYRIDFTKISPINYPLLVSMIPFIERNLQGIVKAPSAIKFIDHFVGSEDIKVYAGQFLNDPEVANYPIGLIDARYKAMDVQYMLPIYKNTPESKQIKLLDLDDVAAVNNISAKYYTNNPLNLQLL